MRRYRCMHLYLLACYFFPFILYASSQISVSTVPDTSDGDVYGTFREGEINVTLICVVFNGLTQVATPWYIQRQSIESMLIPIDFLTGVINSPGDLADDVIVTGDPIPGFEQVTYLTNFTILNFTAQFDGATVQCGTSAIRRTFNLVFPVDPVLINSSFVHNLKEGSPFNLSIQVTEGFPILPQYYWYHNDLEILDTSDSPDISQYPFIKFNNVNRNHTGVYKVEVSVEAGFISTNFTLNVQFGAEGVKQSDLVYAIEGQDISLIAFVDVMGNPIPTSTWSKDNVTIVQDVKFVFSALGQVCIFTVIKSDEGNYTNIVMNEHVGPLSNHLQLFVLVRPSEPLNVHLLDLVGATCVTFGWNEPDEIGDPQFNHYIIDVEPVSNSQAPSVTTSVSSPVNSSRICGLWPSTMYNISLHAVSIHAIAGELNGLTNNLFSFTTSKGVPILSDVNAEVQSGILIVVFDILYDGGSDVINTTISCFSDGGIYTRTCIDCGLQTVFGPTEAGKNYSCIVVTTNSVGSASVESSYISADTGIPSTPVIVNASVSGYTVTIHVLVLNTGGNTGLVYIVTIYNSIGGIVDTFRDYPLLDDLAGHVLESLIIVNISTHGSYYFSVVLENLFGSSMSSESSQTVFIDDDEVLLLPTPASSKDLILIIAASVCFTITILIVVVVCSAFICLFKHLKSNKGKPDLRGAPVQSECGSCSKEVDTLDRISVKNNVSYCETRFLKVPSHTVLYESPVLYEDISDEDGKNKHYITNKILQ